MQCFVSCRINFVMLMTKYDDVAKPYELNLGHLGSMIRSWYTTISIYSSCNREVVAYVNIKYLILRSIQDFCLQSNICSATL